MRSCRVAELQSLALRATDLGEISRCPFWVISLIISSGSLAKSREEQRSQEGDFRLPAAFLPVAFSFARSCPENLGL